MKSKLFILASLCAIAFQANAQTKKGGQFIGGLVSFRSENTVDVGDYAKAKVLQINPNYGHFFSKNLAIGAGLHFVYTEQEIGHQVLTAAGGTYISSTLTTTIKQHGYGIGPFVRYYIDIADKFKFYGQFNASYGFGKSEESSASLATSSTYNSYTVGVLPGLAIFPTKKIAIELGFNLISYNKQNFKNTTLPNNDERNYKNFEFGLSSFSPSIGVNFHW